MTHEPILGTQRNAVLIVLRKDGFNPSDFEWSEATSSYSNSHVISVLTHRPSKYWYKFDSVYYRAGHPHRGVYSPGKQSIEEETDAFTTWDYHLRVLRDEWLPYLKREIETPDLWAAASQEKQLIEAASSPETENTRFSKDELGYISTQLREIKEFLFKIQPLSSKEKTFVEVRIRYLEESASRVGRVDWVNIVVSTFFGLGVHLAFPPDTIRELFRFAGSLLSQLSGGTPLLPP